MQGVDGAIFQMLSHGLVSAALFLCVGVVYDRMHTREIAAYGGLVNRMPLYAAVFMVFTLANVGLPGTSGFIGEFLTLLGAFRANTWVAFLATTGVILSACYALYLYRRMIYGPLEKPSLRNIADMNYREVLVFTPLVLLVLLFGFYPAPLLDVTAVSVKKLVASYETAIRAASAMSGAVAGSMQTKRIGHCHTGRSAPARRAGTQGRRHRSYPLPRVRIFRCAKFRDDSW